MYGVSKRENRAILREQREALRKSVGAVSNTIDWLQGNIPPTKTTNPKRSSYGLKHIAEKYIGSRCSLAAESSTAPRPA